MTMNVDEMKLKNTLSREVHATQHQKERQGARLRSCSGVVHLASVHVIVLVVDVVCLMLVLSARVVVQAVVVQFP